MQVAISPSATSVLAGQNITYTITATNNGLSDATSVVMTDTIPGDVTFISASGGVGPDPTGKLTFSIPALAAGDSASFQVTVATSGSTASPTSSSAAITGGQYDLVTANNSATVFVPVTMVSDLEVRTTAPSTVYVGSSPTYTFTVTNTGPDMPMAFSSRTSCLPELLTPEVSSPTHQDSPPPSTASPSRSRSEP